MVGTSWEIHLLSTYMITYCLHHGLPTRYTIPWELRSDSEERSYTATTQRATHSPPTGYREVTYWISSRQLPPLRSSTAHAVR
jgi:hypothetical protein